VSQPARSEHNSTLEVTHLAQTLLAGGSLEIVRALTQAYCRIENASIRSGLLAAFRMVEDQPGLNQIWAAWAESRDTDLGTWLAENKRPAAQPLATQVLSQLWLGDLQALREKGAEGIAPLLSAASDRDPRIARQARTVLRQLTNPQAQEELCRWVIESDHIQARQAALESGYEPKDPQRRALFYLLTEQWERYTSLDFDSSLVRAVYETGDQTLRTKINQLARKSGWSGHLDVSAGRRAGRRLEALTATEWDVILAVLGRNQRWQVVWQLAQQAPALWSARLLRELDQAGWTPEDEDERPGFLNLAEKAHACLVLGHPKEKFLHSHLNLSGHSRLITGLAASPDGRWLASGSADHSIRLWGLPDGEPGPELQPHYSFVTCLAFHPNAELLASGSADKSVNLYRLPEARLEGKLGGHSGAVNALAFSPDGQYLTSGDTSGVHLWRVLDGRLLTILPSKEAQVNSLAFTSDSQLLVSHQEDRSLHIWQIPDGQLLHTLMETVSSWALHPDGRTLASGSPYGRVRLWRLPQADLLKSLEGRTDGVDLAFSPDGQFLIASDRQQLRVWSMPDAEPALELETDWNDPGRLIISPDSRLLVASGKKGGVRLWQLPDGQPVQTLEGLTAPARQFCMDPHGLFLFHNEEKLVRAWQVMNPGQVLRTAIHRLTAHTLEMALASLQRPEAGPTEQAWQAFVQALFQWQSRYEVELAEAPQTFSIGDLDIEIEG
jgi:WD40 repeat protein